MNILLLTLDTFSRTGGIQQFNRCLQLALCHLVKETGGHLTHMSLGDTLAQADDRYATPGADFVFMGYAGQKSRFITDLMTSSHRYQLVFFGHINLAPLAMLPGLRFKDCRLIAHGVEVWSHLPFIKRRGLRKMNRVWVVSNYTGGVMRQLHKVPDTQIDFFPNCLDPYLAQAQMTPPSEWNKYWRLDTNRPYLVTLARLQPTEQAKGYDTIIRLLPRLMKNHPQVGYLLAGKSDAAEYTRIRRLAESLGVADRVLMPGYVTPKHLPALYSMGKVFVLPSAKEGFGIVYLEAAWWGCPVVAYDAGGAKEALLQGALGTLVPQGDEEALFIVLDQLLHASAPNELHKQQLRDKIAAQYGFEVFCGRVFTLLRPAGIT
jgi:phosphatidyl-myo-inositol dimannoside synthase